MKILDLRLRNLNSLAGEWKIDFTHPAYGGAGLFAITGPTGVGKSTVLDAICLALYGATPRLDKISKSFNELMTKGRGDCAAELTFETPAGRWRCHWSQRRARKKADGELQEPHHEICEADSGLVLESSRSKTLRRVEEITGMDFQQFTRSILLAQGAFAAFLEARPDQRADLLEQITGAAVYTEISKKVHERRDLEKKALEEVKSRLKSLEGPPDEGEDLDEERARVTARLAELEKNRTAKNSYLTWRKNLTQEEKAVQDLSAEERELARQTAEFEPDRRRLAGARLVAGLSSTYERLSLERRNLAAVEADLSRGREGLPAVERLLAEAESAEAEADRSLAQARRAEAEARPNLNEARILDQQLADLTRQTQPQIEKIERLWASLTGLQLSEGPSAFGDFQAWADLLASVKGEVAERYESLAAARRQLEELLKGRDLAGWRAEGQNLTLKIFELEKLAQDLAAAREAAREIDQSLERKPALQGELEALKARIKTESDLAGQMEKQAEHLRAELDLRNRLKDLEQKRASLVDGQPCDLCGALHHPYAWPENLPRFEVDQAALEAIKTERRTKQALLDRLRERETVLRSKLSVLEAGLAKSRSTLEGLNEKLEKSRASLSLVSAPEIDPGVFVQGEIQRLKAQRNSVANLIDTAERRAGEIDSGEARLKTRAERLDRADFFLKEGLAAQTALSTLKAEGAQLAARRLSLLGRRKPDQEEARLAAAVKEAEEKLAGQRRRKMAALAEREKLASYLAAAEVRRQALQKEEKEAEEEFGRLLAGNGLADEGAFLAARLNQGDRAVLEEREKSLATRGAGLRARLEDKLKNLAALKEMNLTALSSGELEGELNVLAENQKELQGRLAVIDQRLEDRRRAALRQTQISMELEKRSLELRRWDKLHDLIGSVDGKKYRNFAQALTFDLMISQANRQLARLSDRYLLLRDPAQPLELKVADHYQAGEIRSTKNLSGGESFIVSLALALGLAQMASRRVRVDSLFLDEGFGTLDEEALELALDTLAALQEDGKLIGVISHIPAMMNRIGTQIEIRRYSGPHSLIRGPGVEKIGEV